MLERIQRPFGDQDRQVLQHFRRRAIGTTRFDAKYSRYGGAAGLFLGFLWLGIFHWGDRGSQLWPIVALIATGAAFGFSFDYVRTRRERQASEAAAAAKWDPVIAVGVVEHIIAETTKAIRIDDSDAGTAWFLQVDEKQILCVWDWADEATERVEVDLVPGSSPTALKISWTGNKLTPLRPKRRFKRGEREPAQCEVIDGTLKELDALLLDGQSAKRAPKVSAKTKATATLPSKLAEDVASLGFYKYAADDQIDEMKGEIAQGAYDWYLAAGRLFDADVERLVDGGVKNLLDDMRPALQVEGWNVPTDIEESYDNEQGHTLRIGDDQISLWSASERKRSGELTVTRTNALINERLAKAGSPERVHVLSEGGNTQFVLLTPAMQNVINKSGVFKKGEIPAPL